MGVAGSDSTQQTSWLKKYESRICISLLLRFPTELSGCCRAVSHGRDRNAVPTYAKDRFPATPSRAPHEHDLEGPVHPQAAWMGPGYTLRILREMQSASSKRRAQRAAGRPVSRASGAPARTLDAKRRISRITSPRHTYPGPSLQQGWSKSPLWSTAGHLAGAPLPAGSPVSSLCGESLRSRLV